KERVVTISRMVSGKRVRTDQALELAVAMFYRIIKTFLGDAWRPQEVCFMHDAPTHPEAHRHFFGTRVRFNWDYNGIVCRAADLEKSMRASDPGMARVFNRDYLICQMLQAGRSPAFASSRATAVAERPCSRHRTAVIRARLRAGRRAAACDRSCLCQRRA